MSTQHSTSSRGPWRKLTHRSADYPVLCRADRPATVGHTDSMTDKERPVLIDAANPVVSETNTDFRCAWCGDATPVLKKDRDGYAELIVIVHAEDCPWIARQMRAAGEDANAKAPA